MKAYDGNVGLFGYGFRFVLPISATKGTAAAEGHARTHLQHNLRQRLLISTRQLALLLRHQSPRPAYTGRPQRA